MYEERILFLPQGIDFLSRRGHLAAWLGSRPSPLLQFDPLTLLRTEQASPWFKIYVPRDLQNKNSDMDVSILKTSSNWFGGNEPEISVIK